MLSRKEFCLGAAATLLGGCTTTRPEKPLLINNPTVPRNPIPTVAPSGPMLLTNMLHPKLREFGIELDQWSDSNHQLVIDSNSDAKRTRDLLIGNNDPRTYWPGIKIPLEYDNSSTSGTFTYQVQRNASDPRRVLVVIPNSRTEVAPWVSQGNRIKFSLSPEIERSSARLAILVKEISMFTDFVDYSKLHLLAMERLGYKTDVTTTKNISTDPLELCISQSNALDVFDERYNFTTKWFKSRETLFGVLIDHGSRIKTASLVGNWFIDQEIAAVRPPDEKWVTMAKEAVDFMTNAGMIEVSGNAYRWKNNQLENIVNQDFLELVLDYQKVRIPKLNS